MLYPEWVTQKDPLLAPLQAMQEVWASGVTYLRSRDARESESDTGDIYMKVYKAERPELFYKAMGWRVVAAWSSNSCPAGQYVGCAGTGTYSGH